MKYQVVVGNVGTVLSTDDLDDAQKWFDEYVELSVKGSGRCGHEPVLLLDGGWIAQEYQPSRVPGERINKE